MRNIIGAVYAPAFGKRELRGVMNVILGYVLKEDIAAGENMNYANGDKFRCGPPMRAGAYEKWNWCAPCTEIYDKEHVRCPKCNQMLRWKAKGQSCLNGRETCL